MNISNWNYLHIKILNIKINIKLIWKESKNWFSQKLHSFTYSVSVRFGTSFLTKSSMDSFHVSYGLSMVANDTAKTGTINNCFKDLKDPFEAGRQRLNVFEVSKRKQEATYEIVHNGNKEVEPWTKKSRRLIDNNYKVQSLFLQSHQDVWDTMFAAIKVFVNYISFPKTKKIQESKRKRILVVYQLSQKIVLIVHAGIEGGLS